MLVRPRWAPSRWKGKTDGRCRIVNRTTRTQDGDEVETAPLDKELQHTLWRRRAQSFRACRRCSVFSSSFHFSFKQLEWSLKLTHLGALIALALAIALIMTPALGGPWAPLQLSA